VDTGLTDIAAWRTDDLAVGGPGAARASVMIDNRSYFAAVKRAICGAQRSIYLLGWCFDPRTRLQPDGSDDGVPDEIGRLLIHQANLHPDLRVHILIWDMALPLSIAHARFPQRAKSWFRDSRCQFMLERAPTGVAHHQKLLVVDNHIAFCSSGDFAPNRWDTLRHRDREPFRRLPSGGTAAPRHEVSIRLEGAAAAAVGAVARRRWRHASRTASAPATPAPCRPDDELAEPVGAGVAFTLALSQPTHGMPAADGDALKIFQRAIASARDCLYLENQFFTCLRIGEALVERLREPDGPQIILITSQRAGGVSERMTMDAIRDPMIDLLRGADRYGRLRVLAPRTKQGKAIVVHSKVAIVDDRLLRIGSMNLNNRSFGLDTECDVVVEASGTDAATTRQAIRRVRDKLCAHFLGCDIGRFADAAARSGGPIGAIDSLDPDRMRLVDLVTRRQGPLGRLVAACEIGDPGSLADRFRPWRRRRARAALLARLGSAQDGSCGS
jgi:phosphatidylserine/phosphatidylglycerophosphate/cardiolipin synthase-like enzyme